MSVETLRTKDVAIADLYKQVRDAAITTKNVSLADRIAVLEVVKAELVNEALKKIHG